MSTRASEYEGKWASEYEGSEYEGSEYEGSEYEGKWASGYEGFILTEIRRHW